MASIAPTVFLKATLEEADTHIFGCRFPELRGHLLLFAGGNDVNSKTYTG